MSDELIVECSDGWLTLWMNRPAVRNALGAEMVAAIRTALEAVRDDRTVRGITLRGKGGVFSAGGDLKNFRSNFQGSASHAEIAAANSSAGDFLSYLNTMPQVVVMLIEGAAIAGGLGIACTGDVVAVTADAKFAITETSLGIPPAQIAPFVVQRIGLTAARRLMLTGARFDGAEAGRLGLADFVAEDAAGLDAIEADIRKSVRRCAPGANAVTKEIVLKATRLPRNEMIAFAGERFADCMLGDEAREGIAAFLDKRKPIWAEIPGAEPPGAESADAG